MKKKLSRSKTIRLFTDGSSRESGGKGGWAYLVVDTKGDVVYEESSMFESTTIGRMEVMAFYKALKWIVENAEQYGRDTPFQIYSDSKYVVKAFNSWMHTWAKKDWPEDKKHLDLWKIIYDLAQSLDCVTVIWVKSHDGNYYNELADKLAYESWH